MKYNVSGSSNNVKKILVWPGPECERDRGQLLTAFCGELHRFHVLFLLSPILPPLLPQLKRLCFRFGNKYHITNIFRLVENGGIDGFHQNKPWNVFSYLSICKVANEKAMEAYANMMIPWVFNKNKKCDASLYGPPLALALWS